MLIVRTIWKFKTSFLEQSILRITMSSTSEDEENVVSEVEEQNGESEVECDADSAKDDSFVDEADDCAKDEKPLTWKELVCFVVYTGSRTAIIERLYTISISDYQLGS